MEEAKVLKEVLKEVGFWQTYRRELVVSADFPKSIDPDKLFLETRRHIERALEINAKEILEILPRLYQR